MSNMPWYKRLFAIERYEVNDPLAYPKEPEKTDKPNYVANAEKIAEGVIQELEANREAKMAEFVKDAVEDKKSYVFQCERWGDYLSVKIKRGHQTYAGAINIKESDAIELSEGSAPSETQTAYVHGYYSGGSCNDYYFGPIADIKASYNGIAEKCLVRQEVIVRIAGSYPSYFGSSCYWRSKNRIENYPKPAQDDYIWFHKSKATICVPHGLGASVYREILKALRKKEK